MQEFTNYSHIKVSLMDILEELAEVGDSLTRELLRVQPAATEGSVKQQIGELQGVHRAMKKLENTFGSQ